MTASSGSPGPTLSESFARWIAALSFERLPDEVVRMARRCLLDTFGCALQGSTTPEAQLLRKVRDDLGGAGPCTVWGTPGGVAPQAAALLNGTHAHLRELDDIGGGGHAGACQVPAAERWKAPPLAAHQAAVAARAAADETSPAAAPASP